MSHVHTPTQEPGNEDPLLTVGQAADYLGISARFIRRELASGNLESVHLGRLVRVRKSQLERYIERASK